jgi:hypothetical protein
MTNDYSKVLDYSPPKRASPRAIVLASVMMALALLAAAWAIRVSRTPGISVVSVAPVRLITFTGQVLVRKLPETGDAATFAPTRQRAEQDGNSEDPSTLALADASAIVSIGAKPGDCVDLFLSAPSGASLKGGRLDSAHVRHWSFGAFELIVTGPIEIPDSSQPSHGVVRAGAVVTTRPSTQPTTRGK